MEPNIRIIQEHGRAGRSGDGLIYTSGVEQVYKVRNEQKGAEAI
ncbi:MAG: hypothetical protein H6560_18815 [Lewinellaceae bacterium]|nr:hypothetical protein [Lewinellaceae bacterium]